MDKKGCNVLVKRNYYTIGFTTPKGLCLDLDDISLKKSEKLANFLLKKYKLQGYLLIKSSPKHYHVVFNKYLSWKRTLQILARVFKCIEWALWQIRKGEITLRISPKKGKNLPKIIKCVGKTDKLIKDYLEIYNLFNGNN